MYSFSALSNRFLEEKYNNQVIQDDYIAMGVYRATIFHFISTWQIQTILLCGTIIIIATFMFLNILA